MSISTTPEAVGSNPAYVSHTDPTARVQQTCPSHGIVFHPRGSTCPDCRADRERADWDRVRWEMGQLDTPERPAPVWVFAAILGTLLAIVLASVAAVIVS